MSGLERVAIEPSSGKPHVLEYVGTLEIFFAKSRYISGKNVHLVHESTKRTSICLSLASRLLLRRQGGETVSRRRLDTQGSGLCSASTACGEATPLLLGGGCAAEPANVAVLEQVLGRRLSGRAHRALRRRRGRLRHGGTMVVRAVHARQRGVAQRVRGVRRSALSGREKRLAGVRAVLANVTGL